MQQHLDEKQPEPKETLTVGRDLLSLRVGLAEGLACPEGGLSQ